MKIILENIFPVNSYKDISKVSHFNFHSIVLKIQSKAATD
jgi:hypothetical protein